MVVIDPTELCLTYSILNNLTQMIYIPTWIPDCDSDSPALLDLFISSDHSICSTVAFPSLRNYDHVVVSVSINSLQTQKVMLLFITHLITILVDWDGLYDHVHVSCSMGRYL